MVHINAPLFARTGSSQPNGLSNGTQGPPARPSGGAIAPTRQTLGPPGGHQAATPGGAVPTPNGQPLHVPQDAGGLRRRANLGSTPFMQQQRPTTPGGKVPGPSGGQQVTQYFPRQDAQTRYNNAMQVESTIVEVSGSTRSIHSLFNLSHSAIPHRSLVCTHEWRLWWRSRERSSRASTMIWTSRTFIVVLCFTNTAN